MNRAFFKWDSKETQQKTVVLLPTYLSNVQCQTSLNHTLDSRLLLSSVGDDLFGFSLIRRGNMLAKKKSSCILRVIARRYSQSKWAC